MTGMQAELQELRRRRRTRRIGISVACVAVLILGGLWLNSTKPTMTCAEWQAEYSSALANKQESGIGIGNGTLVNLEQTRPEGCQTPTGPST